MARTERYTAQEVIDALEKGYTCVGAGQLLGCSAETIRNYANKYPTVMAALKAKRRELVDLAELGLRRAIVNGESWAIALTLKTLGRDDGYGDSLQLTGKDGGDIAINVVDYRRGLAAIAPDLATDADGEG